MKILVTGANGFIGSHLIDRLAKSNQYEIIPWDREQGDLKQPQNFPEVDVVIHLAAYNSTKEFYTKGFEVIKDNILTTMNLLEHYMKQENKPLFMYTGTPESYAGATDFFDYKLPTDEACPLVVPDVKNIRWSYANSKALGEQAVIASGLPYQIIVPNNIYGPRQKNHFVDEFIARAKTGDIALYGWENTRSWLYVEDFTEAVEGLINSKSAVGEKINIGSNDEVEVLKLAEVIIRHMGIDKPIEKHDAPEGSVARRMPDITKIKSLTQWEPTTSLEEGLKTTVEWYMSQ
jgi:nucleoside-diphosphate-sugar epimerase